jgi:hypothetical protein
MSINHSIPLFQTLKFRVYKDDMEWCAKSDGSYDTLGTTIEITAPNRLDLHQQLYSEISDIFFGEYEVDMFVNEDYTIDFLLTQDCIPVIGLRKHS